MDGHSAPLIHDLRPTVVYDTFWKFAVERQNIFFRRLSHSFGPEWTSDPILSEHRFTNVYRASDRVSQYLIRNVIEAEDNSPTEMFFRIILFKIFNKIETWELLSKRLGALTWANYDFCEYDAALTDIRSQGNAIYSGAYIMASGQSAFGFKRKHQNHLKLIEKMMFDRLPDRIRQTKDFKGVYDLLLGQPSIGNFLAYQYAIDLNYSDVLNFSENDFVMPGPGAIRGINKCFANSDALASTQIIRLVMENQEREFEKRGLYFKTLWGRPLHLIDVQNLFCEVDKYARVAHSDIVSKDGRKRIKQKFKPDLRQIDYVFPEKWALKTSQQLEIGTVNVA